jgi:ubiquinone/menaquinone biosynthesis C-methylase UbiE
MFATFARRCARPELIDGEDYSCEEFIDSLADLRRVNRYLGGQRALFSRLFLIIEGLTQSRVRLLDVGTGSADLPIAVVETARRRGIEVEFVVLDLNEIATRQAQVQCADYPEISAIRADALHPPFLAGSFDIVLASLFLHHFETAQAARLVASLARVARVAVIINDLRRHPIAYYSAKLLTRLFSNNRLTRHDGALSVLRGFTEGDVAEISRLAGLPLHVSRHFPYRMVAIANSATLHGARVLAKASG